jgi:hypothetical protein
MFLGGQCRHCTLPWTQMKDPRILPIVRTSAIDRVELDANYVLSINR